MRRFALLAAVLLAPTALLAQPTDRLPDLTPSEFEIRGDLEIDLPQLERQPLSGFGPPPRTYVVPGNRQPITGPYGPGFNGLDPLALAPPPDPDFELADGRALRIEGGFGTEVARYGRFDLAAGNARGSGFVRASFDGIGPTIEFGDEVPALDADVQAEQFAVHGGYRTHGPVRVGIEGGYRRDAVTLPGALGLLSPAVPERRVSTIEAIGHVEASPSTSVPAALRLRLARTDADLNPNEPTITPIPTSPETRFEADGRIELFQQLVLVEGGVGTSSFLDGADGRDLTDYAAGLIIQTHRPGGPSFRVGARVLGFDTSVLNGNGASTNVIAPVAGLTWPLGPTAQLFAHTEPKVVRRDFAAYFAENPYAIAPTLAPDVHTVDAEGGLRVQAGLVGFKAYAGATYSPNRLFFERDLGSGLFGPNYGKARTLQAGADLTVATPSGIEFAAGVAFRDGALTEFDETLPYYASTVGRAGMQVPFAQGKGRLGVSAYFEGERPADRADSRRVPGYGTLSVYGAYELSGGFGVVLRGERLAGRAERWEGYPQVPYAIMGGVRLIR